MTDLSHVFLIISTPIANRPENVYKASLDRTKQLVRDLGGRCEIHEMRYISEICYARSRLFGSFLRSEGTHNLLIDDDMGWDENDVVRMLQHDRDFLAAVGPKKVYPTSFAFNCIDENGETVSWIEEVDTHIATITEVGTAFMMFKKSVAERLVAAYPDTRYDSEPGMTDYAMFDPLIVECPNGKRRRLADDFSFCHRWRKIGGKVQVLLDVNLSHIGPHEFKGNLYEHILAEEKNLEQQTNDQKHLEKGKAV